MFFDFTAQEVKVSECPSDWNKEFFKLIHFSTNNYQVSRSTDIQKCKHNYTQISLELMVEYSSAHR